jgi:hypothetical protein
MTTCNSPCFGCTQKIHINSKRNVGSYTHTSKKQLAVALTNYAKLLANKEVAK